MGSQFFHFENLKLFKNNDFIVYRNSKNEEKIYQYSQIVSLSQNLDKLFRDSNITGARISLQCPHSPELCVILLSILNSESSFCGIPVNANADDICEANKKYRAKYFVSTGFWDQIDSMKLLKEAIILNKTIYIFEILNSTSDILAEKLFTECYSIKTSGSTGIPKVIRVPIQSILPNIKILSSILKLTTEDIILLSSPITFDPFVVEYFLALMNGCALLIIESKITFAPNMYATVLQCGQSGGVTVAQMTPSLFRLFSLETIQGTLLGANTSLRILLLGGERFPSIHEISAWTVNNNWQTRIFNIYGVSEVSCWSTIHELKRGKDENCIPLGSPLDAETEIRVINDLNEPILEGKGYIEIGSASRKCIIGDECKKKIVSSGVLFRSTNDIGYITGGSIFFEGRKDDIVKRYGNRVNLSHITKIISSMYGVTNVYCGFNDKTMQLICFIIKNNFKSKSQIKREILRTLKNVEKPDDIKFVDYFPVTTHGKVSEEDLFKLFKNEGETALKVFEEFVHNVLGVNDYHYFKSAVKTGEKRKKFPLNLSFLDAGGTSFQALTLATQVGSLLKRPEPMFLKMLLDGTTSLFKLLEFINRLSYDSMVVLPPKNIFKSNKKELLKVIWKYDTGKCVDSTPTCYNNVVSVGSHSCLLVTLQAANGKPLSSCILPDRIECQVCYFDHQVLLVGCYDGKMYVINFVRGKIMWHFDCGGMIKARPLRKNNLVVIGNYSKDGNLKCLNMNKNTMEWKLQIGTKGVFSSPVNVNNDSFIVCTLSGEVACIMFASPNIIWERKFQSPIFSTPTRLSDNGVIIAEVSGIVHCLHPTSGTELWNFKSDGNIFSGILVHKEADRDTQIIFGCHDHRIYCLQFRIEEQRSSIMWRKELNSAIYSTPAILYLSSGKPAVISCSTQGNIHILDYFSGSIFFTLSLNGEIFSSPFVLEKKVYIGCRDNNLVCLEYQADS